MRRCQSILHGGDVGDPSVLHALASIAPVTAVRGNIDKGAWAKALSEVQLVQFGDVYVYLLHNLAELDIEPKAAGVQVVVSGHSHKPLVEERDGILYVNPGSAGPRRFSLPVMVGELLISEGKLTPRLIKLM